MNNKEQDKWTDDDQRGLNAAVADAMWYWDDMPMDPEFAARAFVAFCEGLPERK